MESYVNDKALFRVVDKNNTYMRKIDVIPLHYLIIIR